MYKLLLKLAAPLCVVACQPSAAPEVHQASMGLDGVPVSEDAGCLEDPMSQFGQYLGDWDIQDWQLSQDGSAWTEGAGARWNFVCIGDGVAVQDFWLPNDGGVGTNLRVYEPDTDSWNIAWAVSSTPGFSHIQAKQTGGGDIVMSYKSPIPDPPRRSTFHPAQQNSWKWELEMSFDSGASWREVYRIEATRRQ